MSSINPKKLKVAELKRELDSRNISISKNMKKADLVALLLSAIESETGQEKDFSSSEAVEDSATSEADSQAEDTPVVESATIETTIPEEEKKSEIDEEVKEQLESKVTEPCEKLDDETDHQAVKEPSDYEPQKDMEECNQGQNVPCDSLETDNGNKEEKAPDEDSKGEPEVPKSETPQVHEAPNTNLDTEPDKKIIAESVNPLDSDKEHSKEKMKEAEEEGHSHHKEAEPEEAQMENGNASKDSKEEKKAEGPDHARKRRHDDRFDRQYRWEDRYAPPEEEPEEDFNDSLVVLDLYNSDLNFKVSRDRVGGQPLTMEGFAYLWAGARATYGARRGKVCFECKIMEEDAVKHLPPDEPHPRVVRVGWSSDKSGLQLGEDALSYGYGGTGKVSVDCSFTDYGETFHEGDVIGCYLNLEQDDKMEMSFTKNGQYLGVAFTDDKIKLEDRALFPHVLCKNTSTELNFGQKEEPYFAHPEELQGYVFISAVPKVELVRAVKAPENKKDCEVLMMCGLPGAGKTYYAMQKMNEEPQKKYNILGTNAIMEKMRVMGVPRKKNYAGRWEMLIQNATHCLNRLLQIACRKRRNYILDQTNVYASAQRRKMRPFEGFQRKAIVIVPTEEEYKTRFEKRTKDEGKEVPEMAILEMKANFSLPEEGSLFEEVIFTEQEREEAEKLIEKYREEGQKHGPPPEKRSRGGENRSRIGDGGWRQGRGFRGPPSYGNGGGWNRFGGGGPMGFGRGFGPGFRGRGGGFGNRQGAGFGASRGRDFSRGDRRDNFGRRDHDRGNNRGMWQDRGGRGTRGGYSGYNRQNQGRGFDQGRGSGGFRNSGQGRQQADSHNKFQQGSRVNQNTQSVAPQSAQSYTYGHHPNQSYNTQSTASYNASGYNMQHQTSQQNAAASLPNVQAQQQGYQQAYGQQDYSQQWAQYYQQQQAHQTQQYQNYYANYQQYYNQQASQQTPRQ